jgi:hypothetical protein
VEWDNDGSISQTHERWKTNRKFDKGMALVSGIIRAGDRKGQRFISIDGDNKKAIEVLLRPLGEIVKGRRYNSVEEPAQDFIVERHDDDPYSLHVYIFAEKALPNRPSYKNNKALRPRLDANEIPALEIKSEKGITYCSPSIHKNDVT